MSVAKVIEITSQSSESFEDAIKKGIAKTSETVKHIKSAWVEGQQALVEGNRVTAFQVTLKVTFLVD